MAGPVILLMWIPGVHFSRGGQKVKPNHTSPFEASSCFISADIPLMKAGHMAKPNIKKAGRYTQPTLLDTVKLCDKEH